MRARPRSRSPALVLAALVLTGMAAAPLLSGCVVVSAAGAVAVTGVKVGAKATGAVVGAAAGGVGAAGRAVTGSGHR